MLLKVTVGVGNREPLTLIGGRPTSQKVTPVSLFGQMRGSRFISSCVRRRLLPSNALFSFSLNTAVTWFALFVFAAGNDGTNNDKYPGSPTNIVANNVISVAATLESSALARFSNYGIKMVDVAAPGVGIKSSVPGNKFLRVSGTSQAAPFVTNVAAKMKDVNPFLTPKHLRKIIMNTVDKRPYLAEKIKSYRNNQTFDYHKLHF